ncbi:MAG: hypothetical protein ABIH49_02370 [archaeon]
MSNLISLKTFTRTYVDVALRLVEEGDISQGEFYNSLVRIVSEETRLPIDAVEYLSSGFHQALFLGNNGSPFSYDTSPRSLWKSPTIRLLRHISDEERNNLVGYLIQENKDFLRSRVSNLSGSGVPIDYF